MRWALLGGTIALLLLFPPCASGGDVVVDVVCLMDPSLFPLAAYEIILQNVANATIQTQTTARPDLITGAEARLRYFTESTIFHRFELLHITRAHSVLRVDGSVSAVVGRLRLGLMRDVAKGVGVCGIDAIVDPSAPSPSLDSSGDQQWFMNMPALVAPIALGGWILTLASCAVCWFCVCCTAPEKNIPTAQLDTSAVSSTKTGDVPVAVVADNPAVVKGKISDSSRKKAPPSSRKDALRAATEMSSPLTPHISSIPLHLNSAAASNPPPPPSHTLRQPMFSFPVQDPLSSHQRVLELRIPSFSKTTPT
jgi:hypothetical protein